MAGVVPAKPASIAPSAYRGYFTVLFFSGSGMLFSE